MSTIDRIERNMESLRANTYPGRGIVIGMSPDGRHYVQIYWLMGRSVNSRNRVFAVEDGFVRTKPFDATRVSDPSLIIYYPLKHWAGCHIVTNGDQTETILDALKNKGTFVSALMTREYEPDPPHYTPRISGLVDLNDRNVAYRLAILKSAAGDPGVCQRHFFTYSSAQPGVGHCLHTYAGDGSPLPSFAGEPYPVRILDDPTATARYYWEHLDEGNRVALVAKYIEIASGESRIEMINHLESRAF